MNTRPTPLLLWLLAALLLAACGAAPQPAANPAAEVPPAPTASPSPRPTRKPKPTKAPAATATAQPTAEATPTTAPVASTEAPPLPTATAQPTAFFGTGFVTNGGNVRELPVSGAPLDQVNANETVKLLGKNEQGTWYLLETLRHARGWVSATLLRIEPAVAGGVPVVPSTTLGSAAAGSGDWTTHTIGSSQLQTPSKWQVLPLDKAELERMAGNLEAQNSQLGQMLRQFAQSNQYSMLQFLAVNNDAAAAGENVSLIVIPRPAGPSTDELLQQMAGAVSSSIPGIKLVSGDTKHQVNGLPAARVVYDLSLDQSLSYRGVQWYIVSASNVYLLTVSGPADDALLALADRIGHSFSTRDAADDAAASGERLEVINGGNLRRAPQVAATNVIGQVCPGDQVTILERAAGGSWARIRVVVTAPECDPARVPSGAEGWLSTSLLGPISQEAHADLPPSLRIAKLVPFSHERTGVSGLRPESWTLFETGDTFQISSSPEAPDGFIGAVIPPGAYPPGGAAEAGRTMFDMFQRNHADGPAPEIHEQALAADGSGVLLVTYTGTAQGSSQPVRMTTYARTTVTPRGLLVAMATVPADMFPQEEALIRQMVDSLRVDPPGSETV
jgi:hypothetical protein